MRCIHFLFGNINNSNNIISWAYKITKSPTTCLVIELWPLDRFSCIRCFPWVCFTNPISECFKVIMGVVGYIAYLYTFWYNPQIFLLCIYGDDGQVYCTSADTEKETQIGRARETERTIEREIPNTWYLIYRQTATKDTLVMTFLRNKLDHFHQLQQQMEN